MVRSALFSFGRLIVFVAVFGSFLSERAGAVTVTITEYPIATENTTLGTITAGPDGALWFGVEVGKIGRITTAGDITEYTIPTTNSYPQGITAGPDGALWFTEGSGNKIGRITTAGVITEYSVPTQISVPFMITAGPDGALWFTEGLGNKIGRITTAGVITEYSVPTPVTGSRFALPGPIDITAGPDGALWFTEYVGNKIGRITTTGVITEFTIPTTNSYPEGITAGPDGALWFTEMVGNKIGRLSFTLSTIPELISLVESLTLLNQGQQNSLLANLDSAQKSAERGNNRSACNQLGAFINEVDAMARAGRINAGTANDLINGAKAVQASLGCG